MILALARGFVLQELGHISTFDVFHALAEGDGGGSAGDGGGDGGGSAGDGAGDGGGSAGGPAGDGGGSAGDAAMGGGDAGGPADTYGCMDPSATNYNPSATSQTGVTCTYPPAPTPAQCILTANPSTITAGQSFALAWGYSSDVSSISINNGIGVKTTRGYSAVSPTVSTTYTGTVTNAAGTVTCSASVTVNPAPPAPVPGCTDTAATNYSPSATVNDGSCTYPPAPVYGCMDPSATNYNPAATSQTGVTCTYPPAPPAPTCTLAAIPANVGFGLLWTTAQGTAFSINNNIGLVTPIGAGSITVNPSATTVYTGTVTGSGGTATCSATVSVSQPPVPVYGCMDPSATNYNPAATSQTGVTCTYPPAPVPGCTDTTATNYNPSATVNDGSCIYPPAPTVPTCTLTPSSASITVGSSATLSWTTTNATGLSIDNGVGAASPVASGSVSVAPAADTTYTGTVTGVGGTATCSASIAVTTTPPPPTAPVCSLSASPSSILAGDSATLSWTTTNATGLSIDNGVGAASPVASGSRPVAPGATVTYMGTVTGAAGTATCSATVTVGSSGGGTPPGGGGAYSPSTGGGGAYSPNITLAALPRVGAQPLAYLYLSQIPYTGLDLGPLGTAAYWFAFMVAALALSYLALFRALPAGRRFAYEFGAQVSALLNEREHATTVAMGTITMAPPKKQEEELPKPVEDSAKLSAEQHDVPESPRSYSPYDGFKSFSRNGALSIEDIVKGLSQMHPSLDRVHKVEPIEKTEPVYENVEPIYERPEAIAPVPSEPPASASTRGFVSALIEGDRAAVFAGLRQHIRGGGAPEKLITDVVCLLDDAYRARIDGTISDPSIARVCARLSNPVLEQLIAALATAVDSSYSVGVTGAKLALTRALAILGA